MRPTSSWIAVPQVCAGVDELVGHAGCPAKARGHLSRRTSPTCPFVPVGRFVAMLQRISAWGFVVK
jgi:hypothetical protein